MKNLLIVFLSLISFRAFSQKDCNFKTIDSTGVTLILPSYNAKVIYFFDDHEKKAMAQVQWAFDEVATSLCMKKYEESHPGVKIEFPEFDFPEIDVEVFQGLQRVSLSVVAAAGELFHGQTDFITVNYNSKNEIIAAVKEKKNLITMHGKINFHYQVVKKQVVGEFDCIQGNQMNGVVALHGRLTDLMIKINSLNKNEKVDRDIVLENFMGACVEIKDGESSSLSEISRKVRLLKGKIPIYGLKRGYEKESIIPFQISETSFIEI
jgi:hypothetical protein